MGLCDGKCWRMRTLLENANFVGVRMIVSDGLCRNYSFRCRVSSLFNIPF